MRSDLYTPRFRLETDSRGLGSGFLEVQLEVRLEVIIRAFAKQGGRPEIQSMSHRFGEPNLGCNCSLSGAILADLESRHTTRITEYHPTGSFDSSNK